MTSTEIRLPTRPGRMARTADAISQATAVEQARAVAEVQAAVTVAQQMPRDQERALGEMRDSCGRIALANRAFYSVPNRGNGPSVHLARELARIWGNIDYGVKELRRDDDAAISEVLAYAWDQQTNVRSTRSFIAPHARMKQGSRQKLVDLGDIYLSNQNVGARAVRECIFTVLPDWLTEEAQDICHRTLENGEGKPLEQRIADAVNAYKGIGIAIEQIERKIGRKRGSWTPTDLAQLAITYTSITRDGIDKDSEFPPATVTVEDIVGKAKPAESQPAEIVDEATGEIIEPTGHDEFAPETTSNPDPPAGITKPQSGKLNALLGGDFGLTNKDRDYRLTAVSAIIGRRVESSNEVTKDEASRLIDQLEEMAKSDDPRTVLDDFIADNLVVDPEPEQAQ